jgi:nitroreductase
VIKDEKFNIFYDASTLVICARDAGTYVQADCWLAAENLMLAACDVGLATCCIGFAIPVLNTPEVKAELQIPAEVASVAPIIVGYPNSTVAAPSRTEPRILSWLR